MATLLGKASDGRELTYDATLYEFSLAGEKASFADVQKLDARGWVKWRAKALCDWFRRIVPADLEACNRRARAGAAHLEYRSSNEKVARVDAAGKIVVRGPGTADILACQVNALGAGQAARLVTIQVPTEALAHRNAPETPPAALPLATTIVESLKSKGGKLSKDKSFDLESRLGGPVSFAKIGGMAECSVTSAGRFTVPAGLKKGVYRIGVRAGSTLENAPVQEELITVVLKVK